MIRIVSKEEQMRLNRAGKELSKITKEACVEVHKTAQIVMQNDRSGLQKKGVWNLNAMLEMIRKKQSRDEITAMAGVATGYANAMWHFGLMSEKELTDVVGVIGKEGENALRRTELKLRVNRRRKGEGR